MHLPNLLPKFIIGHMIVSVPAGIWATFGVLIATYFLYRYVFRPFGPIMTCATLTFLCLAGWGVLRLHQDILLWQTSLNQPHPKTPSTIHANQNSSQVLNPLTTGIQIPSRFPNLNSMNPVAHENAWIIAVFIVFVIVALLIYLIIRTLPLKTRTRILSHLRSAGSTRIKGRHGRGEYILPGIELGTRQDDGRPVVIDGPDRFVNTLVVGSIGTGKTSRVLTKGTYQDLLSIANGVPMDMIVMAPDNDPEGGLVTSVLEKAHQLGVDVSLIDLRGGNSNVAFNPFYGGNIADIVDDVRAVLKEQMGEQEGFFQAAQDDLIRTVIQVQVPIWPSTDFIQFAELCTDPLHFRAICSMVYDHAIQKSPVTPRKKRQGELADILEGYSDERPYIEARFDAMSEHERSLVLSAARSFLIDTRTEQKLEHFEKITKGLKIVVGELSNNETMRRVLGKSDLPQIDFRTFLSAGKETKGRVIAVITGNRPVGDLFGRLFLVSFKMYALGRPGSETTRRPVYVYIDEFPRYATNSLSDLFAQGRKYRTSLMLAIQARAQLRLVTDKGFLDVVEGSCRNKIYFPNPTPADAKYLQDALGSVTILHETHTENRLNWLGFDNRNLDRKVSVQERIDPRYRMEDLLYRLRKDEAVFLLTEDNQAQVPFLGYTSNADAWAEGHRGFRDHQMLRKAPHWGQSFRKGGLGKSTEKRETNPMLMGDAEPSPVEMQQGNPDNMYVKPTANPKDAIQLSEWTRAASPEPKRTNVSGLSSTGARVTPASETRGTTKDSKQIVNAPTVKKGSGYSPTVKGMNRPTEAGPQAPVQDKLCPSCEEGKLTLTKDGRKWRCPLCGFERKNRR